MGFVKLWSIAANTLRKVCYNKGTFCAEENDMPNYQFVCLECEEAFEEKRPFARSADPATCPACDSGHTKKLLNIVAFNVSTSLVKGDSIPLPMSSGGGCCGGDSCACHH